MLAKLRWVGAGGASAGFPSFPYAVLPERGWTRLSLDVPAPAGASGAKLQLLLATAPQGTVWWDDISFDEIPAPDAHPVTVATLKYRPHEARDAADADRLSRQFGLIPQNYWPDEGGWSDFTLDESGFGTQGLAELYRITGDAAYRETSRRYIEAHLQRLGRPDGLWNRSWLRGKAAAMPTVFNTRAAGWAMEGLLASHRMMPDGRYLDKARRMAEHLVRAQDAAGCWNFNFTQPREEVGIAAKGTALWSLLMYRLYDATGDRRHLDSARRALAWLVANQYTGPDVDAIGSVFDRNNNSGVGYRPWFRVSCTYGSAFFGLAGLEELRLQGAQGRKAG